nr:DUF4221 family protein [uncultured Bacteroides sp.]
MVKILLQLCFILFVLSCTSVNNADLYMLEKTDKLLCFSVSDDVKIPQISVYPFRNNGQDFLSFQNFPKSDIYIYDMNSGNFVKKVSIKTEGDNSVLGSFGGYFAVDMEHIFIPSLYVNTIFVVDTIGNVKQKINYSNTESGSMLIPFIPDSKSQMVFIGDSLYIPQTVNGMLGDKAIEESPIKIVIDTAKATITALPMKFPPLISYKDFGTVGAFGAEYSCCYDEKNFIYSFYADEDLYLTSPTHKKIEKKKAKSKYIDNVTVFRSTEGNFQKMVKTQCEHASYGKILYDKYRDVYYRFAYPPCEINDYSGDYVDLIRSGRKNFSIIILDNRLNIIGETSFPSYTYNSNLSFILEDGLYLSLNHIKNPDYSDDLLRFQKIELKEIRK